MFDGLYRLFNRPDYPIRTTFENATIVGDDNRGYGAVRFVTTLKYDPYYQGTSALYTNTTNTHSYVYERGRTLPPGENITVRDTYEDAILDFPDKEIEHCRLDSLSLDEKKSRFKRHPLKAYTFTQGKVLQEPRGWYAIIYTTTLDDFSLSSGRCRVEAKIFDTVRSYAAAAADLGPEMGLSAIVARDEPSSAWFFISQMYDILKEREQRGAK